MYEIIAGGIRNGFRLFGYHENRYHRIIVYLIKRTNYNKFNPFLGNAIVDAQPNTEAEDEVRVYCTHDT